MNKHVFITCIEDEQFKELMQKLLWYLLFLLIITEVYLGPCQTTVTAQKMKFSITDFFSKCDLIRSFLRKKWKNHFLCSV